MTNKAKIMAILSLLVTFAMGYMLGGVEFFELQFIQTLQDIIDVIQSSMSGTG